MENTSHPDDEISRKYSFLQRLNHDIQRVSRNHTIDTLLSEWRVLSEKLPKGFEKYFKDKPAAAEKETSSGSGGDASKSAPSPSTSNKESKVAESKGNDWSFGMRFNAKSSSGGSGRSSGGGGGGNSGKPIGGEENSDKEKWMLFGAVSALAIAGAIVYFEVGYKEIGWKEFVNK